MNGCLSKVGKQERRQEGGGGEKERGQEKEEEGKEELNLWVFDNCYTCSQQNVERKRTRGRRKIKVKLREKWRRRRQSRAEELFLRCSKLENECLFLGYAKLEWKEDRCEADKSG